MPQFLQRVRMTVYANVNIEAESLKEAKEALKSGNFEWDQGEMTDWEAVGTWEYDDGSEVYRCEE